jgi:hypothetical protein
MTRLLGCAPLRQETAAARKGNSQLEKYTVRRRLLVAPVERVHPPLVERQVRERVERHTVARALVHSSGPQHACGEIEKRTFSQYMPLVNAAMCASASAANVRNARRFMRPGHANKSWFANIVHAVRELQGQARNFGQ